MLGDYTEREVRSATIPRALFHAVAGALFFIFAGIGLSPDSEILWPLLIVVGALAFQRARRYLVIRHEIRQHILAILSDPDDVRTRSGK